MMRKWDHFLAIDWSGAKGERHKGIALALADANLHLESVRRGDHVGLAAA